MLINGKNNAFTLAEVLITIGIIGIVAAITIPNLLSSVNSAKYTNQFKKSLATVSQAGRLSTANYGFDYGTAADKCNAQNGGTEDPDAVFTFCSLFNGALKSARYIGLLSGVNGYQISVNTTTSASISGAAFADEAVTGPKISTNAADYIAYSMSDGSMVAFNKDAHSCALTSGTMDVQWLTEHPQCIGFIDVNGTVTPNRIVSCDGIDPTDTDVSGSCVVPTDINHSTDIYPIIFYDGNARPATPAARYVVNKIKSTVTTDTIMQN